MNVLVVGGAGYVGGTTVDMLFEAQHDVLVYDALLYEESYRKPVNFVYGDVRDYEALLPHLKWADAVIWLAALVGDGACALNPKITAEINLDAVEWMAAHFDGRIVFPSTCSVYGVQSEELNEESPTSPLSVYATTKLKAEACLKTRNAIIFRLGTLFGVGDLYSRIRLDLVVNYLTLRAAIDGAITVYGGEQFRPLLHVRDVAKAIVENIEGTETGIYNLHRQNVRIIDLAYQVRNHYPDLVVDTTEMTFQDTRNYRVSSERARNLVNFNPSRSIDSGIEEIKELVATKRLTDPDNPRYTNQKFLSQFETHLNFRKTTTWKIKEIQKTKKSQESFKAVSRSTTEDA